MSSKHLAGAAAPHGQVSQQDPDPAGSNIDFTALPVASAAVSTERVVYIDPGAAAGGDGSREHPFDSWNFGPIQAGTTYLQHAGTSYAGNVYVDRQASAAAPIVLGVYGDGAAPIIDGTVDFTGASYATLRGIHLTNPTGAAVLIQQGSHNVAVLNETITGSAAGIWIGGDAGGGTIIRGNAIAGSSGAGILVDETATKAGDTIVIEGNHVTGSGADGIQIQANHIIVANNTVSDNGLAVAGASGIQVYASSASSNEGQDNRITGNVLLGNHDFLDQDGNGILLDQWTRGNVVTNNFAMGNDGAGIALYDSAHNIVSGNVVGDNAADSGRTHAIHADLSLNDALGLTKDNIFKGNTVLSFQSGGAAAYVSPASAQGHNAFSGDVLENTAGGAVFDIGGHAGSILSDWNTMLGASDRFDGISLSSPVPGGTYGYSFPSGTALMQDGHMVHLAGWSAAGGLFGN